MSNWIKKDDKVVVIAGNEKGKTGTVLARKGERVVVRGLNVRKKHVKQKTQVASSDIMEREMPMHISNVCLCNEENQPICVKVRALPDGSKELFYVDSGKEIVHRHLRKSRASHV